MDEFWSLLRNYGIHNIAGRRVHKDEINILILEFTELVKEIRLKQEEEIQIELHEP